MPNSAKPKWLETVADFDNNPRAVHASPHSDGALHFVDQNGDVLGIGFPAYLDVHGKYARIGPYFNMATEQGVKVSFNLYSSYALLTYCDQQVRNVRTQKNEGSIRAQASRRQRLYRG